MSSGGRDDRGCVGCECGFLVEGNIPFDFAQGRLLRYASISVEPPVEMTRIWELLGPMGVSCGCDSGGRQRILLQSVVWIIVCIA